MSDSNEKFENATELKGLPPLDHRERRKRKREYIAIAFLAVLFAGLTFAEFRLTRVSTTLPFVNSIFFFGLLNLNIITLIILIWLVFRNMGKLIIERRRKVLGAKLKTKLVTSFLGLSIGPTLVLFVISALYINSSFDKWFSIKIQNTLQSSLDITRVYYKAADERASHFADHIADGIRRRFSSADLIDPFSRKVIPTWISEFLGSQRELLAIDAVEYYTDQFDERHVVTQSSQGSYSVEYPRASFELLERAFNGEQVSTIQQVGTGDLIRCFSPIKLGDRVVSVVAVSTYIPVSLVNKVDEIASVFDDYKDTNPLKYPIKTFYLLLLVSITILIIFVAIWIGFRLAKELTVPVERLVYGAQAVAPETSTLRLRVRVTMRFRFSYSRLIK